MRTERRKIRADEVEVIRAALLHARVGELSAEAESTIEDLVVVGVCKCGCASIDFEPGDSDDGSKPIADGVGERAGSGKLGVIVWGRPDRITALEIYSLGAEPDDLSLPTPESIVPWERAGAG